MSDPSSLDLGDVVARDVDEYIDSLDALEVVMLVFRESQQSWTPDQVAQKLRITVKVARRELDRMRARGIAVPDGQDGSAVRFAAADMDRAAAVARIAAAYGTRRIELINHVAAQTLKRIQSIANAFRLKKDDSE